MDLRLAENRPLTAHEESYALLLFQGTSQWKAHETVYGGKMNHLSRVTEGKRVANRPKVRARIAELQAMTAAVFTEETGIDEARVKQEYVDLLNANYLDYVEWDEKGIKVKASSTLTRDQVKVIRSIKQRTSPNGDITIDLELADRTKALEAVSSRLWPVPKEPPAVPAGNNTLNFFGSLSTPVLDALLEAAASGRLSEVVAKVVEGRVIREPGENE